MAVPQPTSQIHHIGIYLGFRGVFWQEAIVCVGGPEEVPQAEAYIRRRHRELVEELTEAAATATDAAALVAPAQSPLSTAPCDTFISDSHVGQE